MKPKNIIGAVEEPLLTKLKNKIGERNRFWDEGLVNRFFIECMNYELIAKQIPVPSE